MAHALPEYAARECGGDARGKLGAYVGRSIRSK